MINDMIVSDNDHIRFGIDSDGNYGYKKVGADTVTPFKSGDSKSPVEVTNLLNLFITGWYSMGDPLKVVNKRAFFIVNGDKINGSQMTNYFAYLTAYNSTATFYSSSGTSYLNTVFVGIDVSKFSTLTLSFSLQNDIYICDFFTEECLLQLNQSKTSYTIDISNINTVVTIICHCTIIATWNGTTKQTMTVNTASLS